MVTTWKHQPKEPKPPIAQGLQVSSVTIRQGKLFGLSWVASGSCPYRNWLLLVGGKDMRYWRLDISPSRIVVFFKFYTPANYAKFVLEGYRDGRLRKIAREFISEFLQPPNNLPKKVALDPCYIWRPHPKPLGFQLYLAVEKKFW